MTWIKGGEPKVDTTVLPCGHPVLSFRDRWGNPIYMEADEYELYIHRLDGAGCGISLTRAQLLELLPTLQAYAHREKCCVCGEELRPSNGPHQSIGGDAVWCKPCQDLPCPF